MKKATKVIPVFNIIIALFLFTLGGCSNFPNIFAKPTSTSTPTLTATATPTFTATATPTPTYTPTPTVIPSPTATLYGSTSGAIIMWQAVANLSGNKNYNVDYYNFIRYDFVTKIKEILTQSDSKTTSYGSSAISSNGKYLYLFKRMLVQTSVGDNWNSILYQMDLSTHKLTRLSTIPQFSGKDDADNLLSEMWPDISNDGKYLVFNSNRDYLSPTNYISKIYLMDLSDLSIKRIPNTPQEPCRAKFSPDGNRIAFTGWDGNDWEIYIIGIDGTGLQKITNNSASDRYPDWSPDGTKLVFHSDRDGNIELYIYDLTTKKTTRITTNPASDATANWSPDGKMLVFSSNRDGDTDIYAINLETGEEFEIYNSNIEEGVPLWVP